MRRAFDSVLWQRGILVLLNICVFGQTWNFDFVAIDDQRYVTANTQVLAGLSWEGARWAFSPTAYDANWIPLTWLSLMLDVELWGSFAGGFHLTNVLLHTLNALLLFDLLRRATGRTIESFLVAALFSTHPLHVESVVWVSERKDVLSTLFGLASLFCYVRFAESRTRKWYAAAWLAFAASVLSKQMLVTLPCLFFLFDWWPLRRLRKESLPLDRSGRRLGRIPPIVSEKLPFLAVSALSSVVAVWAQTTGGATQGFDRYPLGDRLANAATSYVLYLRRTLWPVDLAAYYPYRTPAAATALAALLFLVLVTAAAIHFRRQRPALLVGWFWYLGTLLPVVGIIQIGDQALADRYTYFPLIGVFFAAIWTISDATIFTRLPEFVRLAAGVAVVGGSAAAGYRQCSYWSDSERLLSHTIEVTTDNWFAEAALGGVLMASPERTGEAETHLRRAVQIQPRYQLAHYSLALLLSDLGQLSQANDEFRQVIELSPAAVEPRLLLCVNLKRMGASEELQQELARLQAAVTIPDGYQRLLDDLAARPPAK